MSVFTAALNALNLSYSDAADLLRGVGGLPLKVTTVQDFARGKTRVPPDVWEQMRGLFEAIEDAADEILADQAEADAEPFITVRVDDVPLGHPRLREAAVARAKLVLGLGLIEASE